MTALKSELLGLITYVIYFSILFHTYFFDWAKLTINTVDWTSVVTLVVALATLWMTYETRKMAQSAKSSIELETQPFLSISSIYFSTGKAAGSLTHKGATRLGVVFTNPGKVLLKYEFQKLTASLNGEELKNDSFNTRDGVIFPGQTNTFMFPILETVNLVRPGSVAILEFHFKYFSVDTEKKNIKVKLQLMLISETTHEWVYLEGPDYT